MTRNDFITQYCSTTGNRRHELNCLNYLPTEVSLPTGCLEVPFEYGQAQTSDQIYTTVQVKKSLSETEILFHNILSVHQVHICK